MFRFREGSEEMRVYILQSATSVDTKNRIAYESGVRTINSSAAARKCGQLCAPSSASTTRSTR